MGDMVNVVPTYLITVQLFRLHITVAFGFCCVFVCLLALFCYVSVTRGWSPCLFCFVCYKGFFVLCLLQEDGLPRTSRFVLCLLQGDGLPRKGFGF
jgi:hypothetical protein